MIEELTKEQESKMEDYVKEYVKKGLDTTPIDINDAIPIVHDVQEKILEKKKTPVVLMPSPVQAWRAVHLFSEMGDREITEEDIKNVKELAKKDVEGLPSFVWPHLDGCFSANIFAFYNFMRDELGITGYTELYEIWEKTINLCLIYPLDNVCVLSDKPEIVNTLDDDLHCEGGPAIKFSDGLSFYYLWGVEVPQWLAETNYNDLKLKDIMKISNADVRAIGLKRFGSERIVMEGHGTVIEDKYETEGYKLVDLSSLFDTYDYAPFLYMSNPSVPGLVHCEGVAPHIKTIKQALEWREDREGEDYEKMIQT